MRTRNSDIKRVLNNLESRWHSHGVKFIRTPKKLEWIKTLRSAKCAMCNHQEVETKIDQGFPLWGILPVATDLQGKFPELCPKHLRELSRDSILPRFAECRCGMHQKEKIFGIGWPGWSMPIFNPLLKPRMGIMKSLMCPNCFVKLTKKLSPSFARGTWTDLSYTPGQFLTDTIMNQNQANFEALIQGHAGAPKTDIKTRAYLQGDQTIPNNVITLMQFDRETYDPGGHFNTTTYRFTAPLTGYYQINVALLWRPNGVINKRLAVYVELNNTGVYTEQCTYQRTVNDYYNTNVSDVIHLTAADFLEVKGYQNSGVACDVYCSGGGATFWAMQFLSI